MPGQQLVEAAAQAERHFAALGLEHGVKVGFAQFAEVVDAFAFLHFQLQHHAAQAKRALDGLRIKLVQSMMALGFGRLQACR